MDQQPSRSKQKLWVVALPIEEDKDGGAKTPQQTDEKKWALFNKVQARLFEAVGNNASLHPIEVPPLKVGTLDGLMAASGELERSDPALDSVLQRLIKTLQNLQKDPPPGASLDQDGPQFAVHGHAPEQFMEGFSWNAAKYRIDRPIRELVDLVSEEATEIDALVKGKLQEYGHVRQALLSGERAAKGSLAVRDLTPIILDMGAGPIDSEYLSTVYIVCPVGDAAVLKDEYTELCPLAIPGTDALLREEDDYVLFSLVVFKCAIHEFKQVCQSKNWTLRECTLDRQQIALRSANDVKLQADAKGLWASLVRLVRTNAAEVFQCCAHLKVMRSFTEAVLRYGLPPDYLFFVVRMTDPATIKRTERRLVKALVHLLGRLKLPGISELDLAGATALAEDDEQKQDGPEAELWSILNATGQLDTLPFVRVLFEF